MSNMAYELNNMNRFYNDSMLNKDTKDAFSKKINDGGLIMDNNDLLLKNMELIANNINKSHSELKNEFKEREERMTNNQARLEERIDAKFDRLLDDLSDREERLDKKVDALNSKFDTLNVDVHKVRRSTFWSAFAITAAAFVGIAAMVLSAINK